MERLAIRRQSDFTEHTLKVIQKYQQGIFTPIKTDREWLDHVFGGVLPQSIIVICGAPFSGKSTELEGLKKSIMDPELNPKANNFVWFSNSLEMTDLSTTLRDLSKNLGKSLKDIIQSPFTDQDLKIVNQYKKEKSDGRFYKNQKTPTPDQFLQMCKDFLDENKDKDLAAIDIDHLALVKAFSNQKQAIDDVIVGCNELKLTYSNSLFIFLSQFNRGILSRIKEKSNEMAAQRSDVYQTDTIFQIADDVYALQNPFQLKVEFYRKVNPKAYDYLRSHFGPKSPGGKVSFPTVGKLFIEILKDRFSDFYYKDLYIRDIEIPNRFKDDNLEDILPEFD